MNNEYPSNYMVFNTIQSKLYVYNNDKHQIFMIDLFDSNKLSVIKSMDQSLEIKELIIDSNDLYLYLLSLDNIIYEFNLQINEFQRFVTNGL